MTIPASALMEKNLEIMLRDLRELKSDRHEACGVHERPQWTCAFCLCNVLRSSHEEIARLTEKMEVRDEANVELHKRWTDAEAKIARLTSERDDAQKTLHDNGVPVEDAMGTFTLCGRIQAYINNTAEHLAKAEAEVLRLRQALEAEIRDAFRAGFAAHPASDAKVFTWSFDLAESTAGDKEPDAYDAWKNQSAVLPPVEGA